MHVLISGSGIAGPTIAYWLSRPSQTTRHTITILEKAPTLLPYGQNVDIQGSAITAIKKMGLMDQIRLLNTTETGTQFVDSVGRSFSAFPIKDGATTASLSSEYEILRGDLAKILYEATKSHYNITYLFGSTIREVISNDDDGVKVELSNGKVRNYDLLVAADGQWSKPRRTLFLSEDVEIGHQGMYAMYAMYFTVPRQSTDNSFWKIIIGLGSRTISTRPDPHGTVRAIFTLMPRTLIRECAWQAASKEGRQAQEKRLRKEFADVGWQARRLLNAMEQAPDFYFHPIQQIKMRRWSQARVVCLGDAAYCPTPLTGMGTSLAIIGAYMLAGELSSLKNGDHPSTALEAYERKFRPFVEKSQKIPSFVPGIMHPATAWKRWMLHAFLRALPWFVALPWMAGRMGDAESRNDGFPLPADPVFDELVHNLEV
ncbi:FAD/NAD(P)-binding domain-containing protein [Clathrospora elynae]|uniref:FAD/NAD(P)-binding domain-containing protein n=1 Tax=Clathrospora elynae TaxID=706981 RepID=A0A6A5SA29_9PLEO|nr:FAD/NAD(P)-binding domain-containing protein [Clathrospora elynae]